MQMECKTLQELEISSYIRKIYIKIYCNRAWKKMKRVGEPRGKYNKKKMTDSHQSNIVRPALK